LSSPPALLSEEKDENGDLRVGCTPSSIVGGNLYAQLACTASLISSISDTMEQTPAEVLGLLADMLDANEDPESPILPLTNSKRDSGTVPNAKTEQVPSPIDSKRTVWFVFPYGPFVIYFIISFPPHCRSYRNKPVH
jgi:hypothetical protein